MDLSVATRPDASANIYADFVASLEKDLEDKTGDDRPLKKQKLNPKQEKKAKKSKSESTSTYVGGNSEAAVDGDKSEKIVRNLFSHITVQIAPFSATLCPTNHFMTDENQSTEKYHVVSSGRCVGDSL